MSPVQPLNSNYSKHVERTLSICMHCRTGCSLASCWGFVPTLCCQQGRVCTDDLPPHSFSGRPGGKGVVRRRTTHAHPCANNWHRTPTLQVRLHACHLHTTPHALHLHPSFQARIGSMPHYPSLPRPLTCELLQRALGVLGLCPQVWGQEAIGVAQSIEGGLHKVTQGLAAATGRCTQQIKAAAATVKVQHNPKAEHTCCCTSGQHGLTCIMVQCAGAAERTAAKPNICCGRHKQLRSSHSPSASFVHDQPQTHPPLNTEKHPHSRCPPCSPV